MTHIINDRWVSENAGLIWSAVNSYRKWDEDLFQIAVIGAIEASKKFDESQEASFTTYILRGMKTAVFNELRKARATMRNGDMTRCELEEYMDYSPTAQRMEDKVEGELFVEYVFNSPLLTDREKDAMKYHVIDSLSYRDIVPIMGISRARIHQLCTSAIKKVREQYERESF